jgi:hypothetical protein
MWSVPTGLGLIHKVKRVKIAKINIFNKPRSERISCYLPFRKDNEDCSSQYGSGQQQHDQWTGKFAKLHFVASMRT